MKMRRVLVRVLRNNPDKMGFCFCIPSWDIGEEIILNRYTLPREIASVLPGTRLFVMTNLGEEDAGKLVFSSWELAPSPLSEAELEELAQ